MLLSGCHTIAVNIMWMDDTAPAGDVKVYVLKSLVPEELAKRFIETKDIAAPMGFAVVVVGVLQLAGDKVPEGNVFITRKLSQFNKLKNGSYMHYISLSVLWWCHLQLQHFIRTSKNTLKYMFPPELILHLYCMVYRP